MTPCRTGKKSYAVYEAAARHLLQLKKKKGCARGRVYRCRACGFLHVGRKGGKK